jgi:predicted transcriptional regulator
MYKKLTNDKICTVDINDDISKVGNIFSKRAEETIFVANSKWHLYGIITMGDYFRKAPHAKILSEMVNVNCKKIEVGCPDNSNDDYIQHIAEKTFYSNYRIRGIPVVSDGKLLFVIIRAFELTDGCRENS